MTINKTKILSLLTAGLLSVTIPTIASAGCVGTYSFSSCYDNSGNSYSVSRSGGSTFMTGYNYNTGVMLPFLAIGFCGAFTTFSTYSLDALKFILQGQWLLLFMHVVLMNILCIGFCWLGLKFR